MSHAPIRFSANGEHGFPSAHDIVHRLRILVDGDMLRGVLAYDMEAGWVEVAETNGRGEYVRMNGQYIARRIIGAVKVVIV